MNDYFKGLHPDLAKRIQEQDDRGGIFVNKLESGTLIEAQTQNTLYKIKVLENDKVEVLGGNYFPEPTITTLTGSTFGGSMIKLRWLGVDMHMEIYNPHPSRGGPTITTTAVKSLKIFAPDGTWQYEI